MRPRMDMSSKTTVGDKFRRKVVGSTHLNNSTIGIVFISTEYNMMAVICVCIFNVTCCRFFDRLNCKTLLAIFYIHGDFL